MDELGQEIHRLFDPSTEMGMKRIPRSDLIVYNSDKNISQLQFEARALSRTVRDDSSMVVHIDGACRNNGKPDARAAYGVYFGPDSSYNTSGLLSPTTPQTSTRAEIEALAHALPIIRDICTKDISLLDIKIASDSSFLVKAMSQWMEDWIEDGGRRADGTKVAHYERLKELNDALDEMQHGDELGIFPQFWHVPRELNREADALANAALDL